MTKKKLILPILAGIAVIIALLVLILAPKGSGQQAETAAEEQGEIVIRASDLSADEVTFLRPEGSKIELIARLGEDGSAKVALGTCHSCNGSPGAYYTQDGDVLTCNNCGLTFPLSVIDTPGSGCHPIQLEEDVLHYDGPDAVLDRTALAEYESLFDQVAAH